MEEESIESGEQIRTPRGEMRRNRIEEEVVVLVFLLLRYPIHEKTKHLCPVYRYKYSSRSRLVVLSCSFHVHDFLDALTHTHSQFLPQSA